MFITWSTAARWIQGQHAEPEIDGAWVSSFFFWIDGEFFLSWTQQ
jgi:hypothetical protein